MQGAWSCLAPLACADLNASTARATAITKQALTRGRRPQNLTTRGCRAASPSTMGRLAHLRPRRVLSSMRSSQTFPSPRRGPAYREAAQTLKAMAETATRRRGPTAPIPLVAAGRRLSRFCRVSATRRKKCPFDTRDDVQERDYPRNLEDPFDDRRSPQHDTELAIEFNGVFLRL